MNNFRKMIGLITIAVFALAMTACEEILEAATKLQNGTYTFTGTDRPQGETGGGGLADIYISKVYVNDTYIRIYFQDNTGNNAGNSNAADWGTPGSTGQSKLTSLGKKGGSFKYNTYTQENTNHKIEYVAFPRIDSKAFKLENAVGDFDPAKIIFNNISLVRPD